MLFKLVMPETRKDTRFPYFRRRIPADVLHKVRGRTLTIPVGNQTTQVHISDNTEAIRFSLRTADPSEDRPRWPCGRQATPQWPAKGPRSPLRTLPSGLWHGPRDKLRRRNASTCGPARRQRPSTRTTALSTKVLPVLGKPVERLPAEGINRGGREASPQGFFEDTLRP